ncbi:MAG: tRNA (adenosine(37)-N6)-threonylcarbamoyltransferase complex dimerization subunit type 1 TsaB [Gemmatimonadota bacterium]|nr:tRNA (adenosine(37)-N6)-threonylcarbamoyltransferase complex dimerization subunit type 1 TsaB [Gemmatimonadota bacterium]
MIVIGLETSSSAASIAVAQDHQILAETFLRVDTLYAEQLPGLLKRTLAEANVTIQGVDGFAVSIGPGSYTGLRVGLSLVKGLAFATGKPFAAVPTLDAVAYNLPYCRYPVHVMLDARRGQVYAARYDMTEGRPERASAFQAAAVEDIISDVHETAVFAGSGAEVYRTQIYESLGDKAHFLPPGVACLHASSIVCMGAHALQQGEHASLYDLEPLYLRRPIFTKQPATHSKRVRNLSGK